MKNFVVFLLFAIFLFGSILPFFKNGFFPIHDDTQVARMYEMGKALGDGMFPVRWSNDLGYGYGYPLFTFYAPLSYYLGGLIVLLGFSALAATKTIMGLGVILAGITMFLFVRSIWGSKSAVIAGILYTYALYHALDIYVRGDMAEFWAYAIVPLIFYGLWQIRKKQTWKYVIVASLSYAALICTHNLSALMVTPVIFLWAVISGIHTSNRARILLFVSIVTGLFLAGFYFIPVIFEMSYTDVLSQIGGAADFHKHFVCPLQFWYSPWGFGGSIPGCIDGLSFMLSKITFFLSSLGLIGAVFLLKKNSKQGLLGIFLAFGLIISLFLATSYTESIWNFIKPMAFFQYPWRFLFLASFFSSLLGGYCYFVYDQLFPKTSYKVTLGWILVLVAIALIYIYQSKYFMPQKYLLQDSDSYTTQTELTWRVSKTSDEYMPRAFTKPVMSTDIPRTLASVFTGTFEVIQNKTQRKQLRFSLPSGQIVHLNIAFFPGWEMTLDGKQATFTQTPNGMSLLMPSGNHTLVVFYKETFWEMIGDSFSLAGIFILVVGIIYTRKSRNEKS